MSDPDPSIVNGTCFYARGKKADKAFLPCGNWYFGHVQCCQVGDSCLEDNACFNAQFGTTYLAGCSDQNYEDAHCPDKKAYHDYPWAGLIYCKPSRWVACEEAVKPTTVTTGDQCTCPPKPTPAFEDGSPIPGIGHLPLSMGGTMAWAAGYTPNSLPASQPPITSATTGSAASSLAPTSTFSITSTATSSPASASTLFTTSTATPASGASPEASDSTLSTGAKAGIGIGSVVGAMLLFGALSALWVLYRRMRNEDRKSDSAGAVEEAGVGSTDNDKHLGSEPAEMPTPSVPDRPDFSELAPSMVLPELQGNVTGVPGYGYGSEHGWHNQGYQGWGAGASGNIGFESGMQGRELDQSRLGSGQWAPRGEVPEENHAAVFELAG